MGGPASESLLGTLLHNLQIGPHSPTQPLQMAVLCERHKVIFSGTTNQPPVASLSPKSDPHEPYVIGKNRMEATPSTITRVEIPPGLTRASSFSRSSTIDWNHDIIVSGTIHLSRADPPPFHPDEVASHQLGVGYSIRQEAPPPTSPAYGRGGGALHPPKAPSLMALETACLVSLNEDLERVISAITQKVRVFHYTSAHTEHISRCSRCRAMTLEHTKAIYSMLTQFVVTSHPTASQLSGSHGEWTQTDDLDALVLIRSALTLCRSPPQGNPFRYSSEESFTFGGFSKTGGVNMVIKLSNYRFYCHGPTDVSRLELLSLVEHLLPSAPNFRLTVDGRALGSDTTRVHIGDDCEIVVNLLILGG
jgi:guanyl-specific ribonuclease Sa